MTLRRPARVTRAGADVVAPRVPPAPGAPVLCWAVCNRATGVHLDWAHHGEEDRCLCRAETRPCVGDCGLPDCSWLTLSGQ